MTIGGSFKCGFRKLLSNSQGLIEARFTCDKKQNICGMLDTDVMFMLKVQNWFWSSFLCSNYRI